MRKMATVAMVGLAALFKDDVKDAAPQVAGEASDEDQEADAQIAVDSMERSGTKITE